MKTLINLSSIYWVTGFWVWRYFGSTLCWVSDGFSGGLSAGAAQCVFTEGCAVEGAWWEGLESMILFSLCLCLGLGHIT